MGMRWLVLVRLGRRARQGLEGGWSEIRGIRARVGAGRDWGILSWRNHCKVMMLIGRVQGDGVYITVSW